MKKRWLAALLALALLLPGADVWAAGKGKIPDVLRFTQKTETEKIKSSVTVKRTYPHTANKQVDREMRELIDQMAADGQEKLPKKDAYLDVGATIFRTGDRYMSFLTVSRIVTAKKQIWADCASRVYDMETGKQAQLSDLFPEDSPAWALLENEARRQIEDYFSGEAPDEEKLNALCTKEAIRQAGFTLSPGKLSLHYRAGQVYEGKFTLMHVDVYYPVLREYMTDLARAMTDVSGYKLIALTYDDGPARGLSMSVMNHLRLKGAVATFFLVGSQMKDNDDVICRQHDAGHTVASHNYRHTYEDVTRKNAAKWREQFDRRLNALVGRRAEIMRAPGGNARAFIDADVGLPLIQWSNAADDAPYGNRTGSQISQTVNNQTVDGAVLLMHDMNKHSPEYTESLLNTLESRNFLCVTVQEMFSIYGVELEPNKAYTGCDKLAKQAK